MRMNLGTVPYYDMAGMHYLMSSDSQDKVFIKKQLAKRGKGLKVSSKKKR